MKGGNVPLQKLSIGFRPISQSGRTQAVNISIPFGYEVDCVILPPVIQARDEFSFEIPNELVGVPLVLGLKLHYLE